MAVFANEIWGLRSWLSGGGAKESELKEIKGEGKGTKTKKGLHRDREERTEYSHHHPHFRSDHNRNLLMLLE